MPVLGKGISSLAHAAGWRCSAFFCSVCRWVSHGVASLHSHEMALRRRVPVDMDCPCMATFKLVRDGIHVYAPANQQAECTPGAGNTKGAFVSDQA